MTVIWDLMWKKFSLNAEYGILGGKFQYKYSTPWVLYNLKLKNFLRLLRQHPKPLKVPFSVGIPNRLRKATEQHQPLALAMNLSQP